MDLNLVVLGGKLAAPHELRVFADGASFLRYLVIVHSEEPKPRVDVVPIVLWDPSDDLVAANPQPGQRIWAAGSVQRRFVATPADRASRIEVVASHVELRDEPVGFVSSGTPISG